MDHSALVILVWLLLTSTPHSALFISAPAGLPMSLAYPRRSTTGVRVAYSSLVLLLGYCSQVLFVWLLLTSVSPRSLSLVLSLDDP